MVETIELPGRRRTTRLGFGGSSLMGGLSERESLRLLETAYDAGILHFDVAPSYGHGKAESCLGKFLRGKADQLTITTKYGILPPQQADILNVARSMIRPIARQLPTIKRRLARTANRLNSKARFSVEEARRSLENSLRELGLDRVDLFLLHEATADDLERSDLLPFLEEVRQQGRIGMYGIGSDIAHLDALWRRHSEYCRVLQFSGTIQYRKPNFPGAFLIHHRAVSGAIHMIQNLFQGDAGLCSRWSDALDLDLANPEAIGALLLNAALAANPDGLVLFSSRQPRHIYANVCAAGDLLWIERTRLLRDLIEDHAARTNPDRVQSRENR